MNEYLMLLGINKDAAGWVSIPGTDIDYPMAQAADNKYYLTHNIKREFSRHGCLFMDCRNSAGDLNTVIYGHDMKDGTFFGKLSMFLSKDYCAGHQIIECNIRGAETRWQIFSVRETDDSDSSEAAATRAITWDRC